MKAVVYFRYSKGKGVLKMTKEQYEILIDLIDKFGEVEENFGDFCCNTNREIANNAYSEIVNYLNSICE
jgi:Tfp pilus assembly protein PilF